MGSIGFINSDKELKSRVEELFEVNEYYEIVSMDNRHDISDFLDYELSEILIINFSDVSRSLIDTVVKKLKEDSWLHSFGIIGVYDDDDEEEELLDRYSDLNIMVMMSQRRLKSHLIKSLDIISRERHIIFQKVLIDNLVENASGTFLIESDVFIASIYASIITTALSQRGVIAKDKKMFMQLVLSEMIVNAIEHGNCGITYEEKSEFLEKGLNIVDLIAKKCEDPAIARKRVYFEWAVNNQETVFVIRDEGSGFDVNKLKSKIEEEGALALHGRGIKMAVKLAKEIRYNKKGNRLKLVFENDETVHKETPGGFDTEEVLTLNKGDVVFREDELGDFLYYIIAGTYNVYVEEVLVGRITPSDVFMGEMSFLMQNHRSATVIANCPGKILKISRNSYINAIKKYPHYAILLSKLLAKKLVRANDFKVRGEISEV
ncbi:cyclic nucleotide-binding domain-containing protein [Thiospirochaeta perfilievii]|uniref:Cyclic nucleotide-binding domain-containing protein n=1 Tax=Thiospirochaeta perfilievii TaxID=252967 RepID=A0A5C1QGB0_9SPIO|nr:cyclic nucleotide-binding domain-containing protein [Thiospirochaeta perfilievii]QEN05576.1 cyclic nucleotide-binding domain-containing protein [Thiospirochaeta perfilievii]